AVVDALFRVRLFLDDAHLILRQLVDAIVAAKNDDVVDHQALKGWIEVDVHLRGVLHTGRTDDLADAAKVFVDIRAGHAHLVIVEQPFDARADVAGARVRIDGNRIDPSRRAADFELSGIIRADGCARRGGEQKDGDEGTHWVVGGGTWDGTRRFQP